MAISTRSVPKIKPTGIYAYFDKIQFWVRSPLDRRTLAHLGRQCGRGGIHVDNRSARFSAQYRQRIELRQPTAKALRWLARRDDALINRAEITVDYVFNNWADRDDAWAFLHRHLVRRWHGKKQEIRVYPAGGISSDKGGPGGSRYDAGGSAPNKLVLYRESHTRVTGEVACLHLEWRAKGLKAVRAAGIKSGRDLLKFDHRQFWKKRLLLYSVEPERLGRLIRNRASGGRSRRSEIKQTNRFRVNIDRRTGEVHVRARDTVQELIDQIGASSRVRRALVPISGETLLPG
jgi:hypothetical protein